MLSPQKTELVPETSGRFIVKSTRWKMQTMRVVYMVMFCAVLIMGFSPHAVSAIPFLDEMMSPTSCSGSKCDLH